MRLPFFGRLKRPRLWLITLGLVGLVAAGTIAFVISRRGSNYDLDALTVPVVSEELTVLIPASGSVKPIRTTNLSPKSAGFVEELYVDQGDLVTQGQLIARMDNEQLNTQIAQKQASVAEAQAQLDDTLQGSSTTDIGQAQAAVEAARAQLDDARAQRVLAEEDFSRSQNLFDRGAISRSDLDRALNDSRSASAGVDQAIARLDEAEQRLIDQQDGNDAATISEAEARLDRAQAQLQEIQVQLSNTQIRAPFDGVVTQRFASEGSFVTPTAAASEVTPAIVAITSGLKVVAEVPEEDINRIKVGQSVEIQADAFSNETFKGEVQLIAPEAIERQDVTLFEVDIRLLSGTDRLRSNMKTTVAFIGDQLADALVIPPVAVITQGGETGVLIPDESGQAQFEPVVLGSQVGDRIQVIDGLDVGDRVFIDLPPGQSLENLTFGRN